MGLFPPGKGGGDGVEYGYKGKGVTIHLLVDKQGWPLCVQVTSAKVSERAQVMPMLEKLCVKTGKRGRPRKRPLQLAADKGYDSKELRNQLREKGIRPEIPKRVWKNRRKPAGRLLVKRVKRFVVERTFSWLQRKFRRVTIRWERLPCAFQGFVSLGVSFMWLQRLILG